MKATASRYLQLFKQAGMDWMNDHAPRLGASLAFYTLFSLAPLITIVISIAGLWFTDNASGEVFTKLGAVIGTENAKDLQEMLVQPGKDKSGIWATVSASVMLFIGATGVFVQLQDALNAIWEVKPKSGQGVMGFIRNRLLSLAAVFGIGFLLLVSLLLSAGLAAMGKFVGGMLGNVEWLLQAVSFLVSFGIITVLFAFMFKFLPDAKIQWRDVWFGAVVTSLLFAVGKFGLAMYLGKSSLASTYSAAGALIIVLLWVYYSAQILFFGAEITQAYAAMNGRKVEPSEHAEWDAAKIAEREQLEKSKAKKAKNKAPENEERAAGVPAVSPVYAMGSAAGSESGSGESKKGRTLKALGGLVLLALAFIPLERKITGKQ